MNFLYIPAKFYACIIYCTIVTPSRSTKLTYRDVMTRQTIYVVKTRHCNLLGLPAIEALKIATLKIHMIDDDSNQEDNLVKKSVRGKFPPLFQGLCNLGEPYTTTLQSDAKPHSLFTAIGRFHYLYTMQ